MSAAKEIKQLQKAKLKAQSTSNLKEEASLCNQLGDVLAKNGDYRAAIEEHRQELALSEVLHDVIGCAVANRKIGECYAELGDIGSALKHQRRHLDLARSVHDAAEEQRALATIGRTYLFLHDSDQSQDSLKHAEDAFKKSLAIVDGRLEGSVSTRELSEMRARLLLNLGFVCDGLKDPQRCSDFIRQSIYISEKNNLLEDLYRANFNLGSLHFRNGQHSLAIRCFEKSRECAHKMNHKFSQSECFYSIGKVRLNLGDLLSARRCLKKAFCLGSQHAAEREAVKRDLRYAIRGCQLEEDMAAVANTPSQEVLGLAEALGDLYCKVGCYTKALEAYHTQLSGAEALGKPARELAVIHVSLAATYSDLRQYDKALEHYRQELELRRGNPKEECETWLNIASCQEEKKESLEQVDRSYTAALHCAERAAQSKLQRRVLKAWLNAQKRASSAGADTTEARLQELCEAEGCGLEDSDEEEEEEMQNSEPLDSDIQLSDSDDDLEGYDKVITGRRKTGRWNRRNEKGETTLHRACIEGNLKQVQYLVEQGHPINPRDHCGWTPLHEACNYGHLEIVSLLLDKGANVNDPGGTYCDGVTPLHDALNCGHFEVARLLIKRGASVNIRNNKGDKPIDTLKKWMKTYGCELDQETRKECSETEKLLKRALAGGVATVPVTPKPMRDSQLFDAECSEPLLQQDEFRPTSQHGLLNKHTPPEASTPPRAKRSTGPRHQPRGTEENILFGDGISSSEHSDSDISPLRPVRPRHHLQDAPPALQEVRPSQDIPTAHGPRDSLSGREQYHRVIQNLGSAKSRLLSQTLSEPAFSSTPAVSANHLAALVPEDDYIADDWLEDDLVNAQPKKKRRVDSEKDSRRDSVTSRGLIRGSGSGEPSARVQSSSSRGVSLKKNNKARQIKMNQLPGMVVLGRREVSRSPSPIIPTDDDPPQPACRQPYNLQPQAIPQQIAPPLPAPIRMRVRVQNNVFLIPVPHSEADSCTVSWLCEQAAQRYYQSCGLLPRLSLQKEGALLSPADPLLAVLHTNEEVLAEVCSWDLPPLPERYKKACKSLDVGENRWVLRLCEVQDGSPSVSVCGLSLPPACLVPLLRALKLQSSLTELRLSANRFSDDLLPELVSAAATMPRLRLLDISSNQITGEGFKKAASSLEGTTQPAFPCLEELNVSMNPLGDGWSQALASLLSVCPLLATLSLQACGLTARFLQQHRLLLASALTGTGHLRSVCLSQNALGSTGFELVLKTLPLQHLTHLELNAVCKGPSDQPALDLLTKLLTQGDCSLTHLGLAANSLTDQSICCLARCLPLCPSLVSLDLSSNPSVTSVGLHNLLTAVGQARCPLTHLNLQGCQVCGPWDAVCLDNLAECVRDLRLCTQRLNKLDQETLQHSWPGRILSRNSKFLLSIAPDSQ